MMMLTMMEKFNIIIKKTTFDIFDRECEGIKVKRKGKRDLNNNNLLVEELVLFSLPHNIFVYSHTNIISLININKQTTTATFAIIYFLHHKFKKIII